MELFGHIIFSEFVKISITMTSSQISGLSMTGKDQIGKTILGFDQDCNHIQGFKNIILYVLDLFVGLYMIIKDKIATV